VSQAPLEIRHPGPIDRAAVTALLGRYRVDQPVHVVFIGTKPDIIKQFPLYKELADERGLQVLLFHSGQHNDYENSGAMLSSFGLPVGVGLVMADGLTLGGLVGGLVTAANELFDAANGSGHTLIPYIHGDTATSMGVAVAAYMNRVACVHVEAGIRTLTPKREFWLQHLEAFDAGQFDWASYLKGHRLEETYELGSREPFPEQFNTRTSDAATGFHAAPVELDRRFLLSEGYPADAIAVVGNTVVDALDFIAPQVEASPVVRDYPPLASGQFIRMCIHRRENTQDRERFTCYFDAIENLLRSGHSVLWVLLRGTQRALDSWDLQGRLKALEQEFPDTFITRGLWPEYHDGIAALRACALLATDSGSMQEEANALEIPCVTLRFGTDRGESLLAGGNVLAPPLSPGFVTQVIESAFANRADLRAEPLYGTNCSARLVDEVLLRTKLGSGVFRSEEEVLRLPGSDSDWPTDS
jgi:UDP-N-acetylglucosamine 2-epimerase (non-hydrolysing)